MSNQRVRYRMVSIAGRNVFYREAGDPGKLAVVLLHGFPSSSHMYRDLIPELAEQFHVIAPDYIGFGYSDAPASTEFEYTFDNLTSFVTRLIDELGLTSYVLYMQDYGGPVGFRIFQQRPQQVAGFVIQNANAYLEGVSDAAKEMFLPLWADRNAITETPARGLLTIESTRFQYTFGAKDPEKVSPDAWMHDQALLDRPGTSDYQIDLLENYKTNVASYDAWQEGFRKYQPKTLIVWGKNDPYFIPPGAEAYLRDLPGAKLVWLDGGHFALEEYASKVAAEIRASFGEAEAVIPSRGNAHLDSRALDRM
jgi:pimeloyl-ACP methyl ester carboxylesterase